MEKGRARNNAERLARVLELLEKSTGHSVETDRLLQKIYGHVDIVRRDLAVEADHQESLTH